MSAQKQTVVMQYTPTPDDVSRRENNFTYHAPNNDQAARYVGINNYANSFSELLEKACPKSRELSIALTNLEQVCFWANAAIARNE